MGIKITQDVTKEWCIERIKQLLDEKRNRIVRNLELNSILKKIDIIDNALLGEWLTEDQFGVLFNNLETLSNKELEDLLELLEEDDFRNFDIVD